jgi:hypothetical protein
VTATSTRVQPFVINGGFAVTALRPDDHPKILASSAGLLSRKMPT